MRSGGKGHERLMRMGGTMVVEVAASAVPGRRIGKHTGNTSSLQNS